MTNDSDYLFQLLKFIEELAESHEILTYLILGISSFIENIFPPIPGDTITIFGAFLVGLGSLNVYGVLISTTIGSVLGFMGLYLLSYKFGREFIIKRNWKFLNLDHLNKALKWFNRYGYLILLLNRFLPVLRSVISISSGIIKTNWIFVILLSSLSALFWNSLLLYLGYLTGEHWIKIVEMLQKYNRKVIIIISIIVIIVIGFKFYKFYKIKKNNLKLL